MAGRDNRKVKDERRAEAFTRLGKACMALSTDQTLHLCQRMEEVLSEANSDVK